MLFMVIERNKDTKAVYKRFGEKGRMLPEGVKYITSWVNIKGDTCYQVMESESEDLLNEWASNWSDIVDFEFIPVISSRDMSEKMSSL